MKKEYTIENIGNVCVVYNSWTGAFNVFLDGKQAKKIEKKFFVLPVLDEAGQEVHLALDGNVFKGINFYLKNKCYNVVPKMPWHGYILCLIPLIMVLVLGNIPYLAEQGIYFVGGAIGGLIGGLFTALSLYAYSCFNKWYFKVLVAILAIILTFLACWGLGSALVTVISD